MKIYQSLPQNETFYQYYAGLVPALYRVGILSQLFSAAIELYILTSILRPKLEAVALGAFAAFLCAALLVALLEGGLRTGAAYCSRAVLFRKWRGLDLPMSVFVFLLTFGLLVCSLVLHIEGSKEAVTANDSGPKIEHTNHIDAAADKAAAEILRVFRQDSAAIVNTYAALIGAARAETKAAVRAHNARPGATYSGAADIQAQGAAKVATLEAERAAKMGDLVADKGRRLDLAQNRHYAAADNVETRNEKAREQANGRAAKYSSYLSTFSVLTVVFFLLTIALNEINAKGAGIEPVAIPHQYQFEPGILSKLWAAICEKFQYHARAAIERIEAATPQPAQPIEPHNLYNWKEIQQGRRALQARPRVPQDLAAAARERAAKSQNLSAAESVAKVVPARAHNSALSYDWKAPLSEPIVKLSDPSLKPCKYCQAPFRPRTTWQQYCTTDCKNKDHEAKHGAPFDPSKFKYKRANA